HIATHVGTVVSPQEVQAYDASGTRRRHMMAIRSHLAIHPYDHAPQQLLETVMREAAQTKDDLVDLINIGIEELIRQRYELPGFTTLRRTAQRARAEINRALFQQVAMALGTAGALIVEQLLQGNAATRQAPWNRLKADPGRLTLTQLRDL